MLEVRKVAVIHPLEMVARGLEATIESAGFVIVLPDDADVVVADHHTGAARMVVVVEELTDAVLRELIAQGANAVIELDASRHLVAQAVGSAGTDGFYLTEKHLEALVGLTRHGRGPMGLTPRERRVVELLNADTDMSNKEIAQHMGISAETVKTYISNVNKRLGARSRMQIVHIARQEGLVEPP